MPTQQVTPDSPDHLQDVANALLKARKVIVITGAGISTNSGIPVGPASWCSPPLFYDADKSPRTFGRKTVFTR